MSTEELSARFVSRLTNQTIAVVLAGGRGSRLEMLTDWRAKPAVPFGGKFRIIDFPLSNCLNSGVRKICVLTQYKSHSLMRHLMRGWNILNVEIGDFVEVIPAQQWVDEDTWFEGTADAVYQSLDIIQSHSPEYALILAGDHVYQMDYGELLAVHAKHNADLTVACMPVTIADAKSFGVMSNALLVGRWSGRVLLGFSTRQNNQRPHPQDLQEATPQADRDCYPLLGQRLRLPVRQLTSVVF